MQLKSYSLRLPHTQHKIEPKSPSNKTSKVVFLMNYVPNLLSLSSER